MKLRLKLLKCHKYHQIQTVSTCLSNWQVVFDEFSMNSIKNYKCTACSQQFKRNDSLMAHYKLVHQKIKKKCDICGKQVAPTSFKRHKKSYACQRNKKIDSKTAGEGMKIDSNQLNVPAIATEKKKPCPRCQKIMHVCSISRHLSTQACNGIIASQSGNKSIINDNCKNFSIEVHCNIPFLLLIPFVKLFA